MRRLLLLLLVSYACAQTGTSTQTQSVLSGGAPAAPGTAGNPAIYTGSNAIGTSPIFIDATQMSGSDAFAKANTAIGNLPAGGGTIYMPVGAQSVATTLALNKANVTLLFAPGSVYTTTAQNVQVLASANNTSIVCLGSDGAQCLFDGSGFMGNTALTEFSGTSHFLMTGMHIKGNRLKTASITSLIDTANVVTMITSTALGLTTNTWIGITGTTNYNGAWKLTSVNDGTKTYTFAFVSAPAPESAGTVQEQNGTGTNANGQATGHGADCFKTAVANPGVTNINIEKNWMDNCGNMGIDISNATKVIVRDNDLFQTESMAIQIQASGSAPTTPYHSILVENNRAYDSDTSDTNGQGVLNQIDPAAPAAATVMSLQDVHWVHNQVIANISCVIGTGCTQDTASNGCNHTVNTSSTGCGQGLQITTPNDDWEVSGNLIRNINGHECYALGGNGFTAVHNIASLCNVDASGVPLNGGAGGILYFVPSFASQNRTTWGFGTIANNQIYDSGYGVSLNLSSSTTTDDRILKQLVVADNNIFNKAQTTAVGLRTKNSSGATACGASNRNCQWTFTDVDVHNNTVDGATTPISWDPTQALGQWLLNNNHTGVGSARVTSVAAEQTATGLTTITNLAGWIIPPSNAQVNFHCNITWAQRTAISTVTFSASLSSSAGSPSLTVNTKMNNGTTNGVPLNTTIASASTVAITGATAPTAFLPAGACSVTPAACYQLDVDGSFVSGTAANTINLKMTTGNAADAAAVEPGSQCFLLPNSI